MNNEFLFISFLVLVSIVASVSLFLFTPYGLALSPDSVAYIKGAKGIYSGQGLSLFQLLWPPLYPYSLSFLGLFTNGDLLLSARIFNSILYGLNIILTCLILYRANINKYISLLITIFIFSNEAITHIHFYAWTEAGFIFLLLINIFALQNILNNHYISSRYHWHLIILSATTAASILMRHTGLVFLISNLLIIFFLNNSSFLYRLKRTIPHLIYSILLISPWIVYYISSNNQPRSIAFHFPDIHKILSGFESIGNWYFSIFNLIYIKIALGFIVCLTILIAFFIFLKSKIINQFSFSFALCIYFIIYLVFLVLAITLIDSAAPLDSRILSPLFILFTIFISINFLNKNIKVPPILIFLFFLFITAESVPKLRSWLLLNYYQGFELSSITYKKNLPVLNFIDHCNLNSIVKSNSPWDFDLIFNKKVDLLPLKSDMFSGILNRNYKNDIQNLSTNVDLIIITDLKSHYIHEIDQLKTFKRVYDYTDAIVWENDASKFCSIN